MIWISDIFILLMIIWDVQSSDWPGSDDVTTEDKSNALGSQWSGLKYITGSPDAIYGVTNEPSKIYKLEWDGSHWSKFSSDDWSDGKTILYPNGKGSPDSEDLTFDDQNVLYVCSERDNDNNDVSRLSVLKYSNYSSSPTSLTASCEWNLTDDLPSVDPNSGFEGIAWIDDDYLVKNKLIDQNTGNVYDPANYPNHGSGVFLLGLEDNGHIYAYVLFMDGSGKYKQISSFSSQEDQIMSVQYDLSSGYVWTECDNSCKGRMHVFIISNEGKFEEIAEYDRPSTMPNYNNEGFTLTPDSECVKGMKSVYWSDDDNDDGHVIRVDTVPCGAFIKT